MDYNDSFETKEKTWMFKTIFLYGYLKEESFMDTSPPAVMSK
jgi:hypothetical protein